MANTLKFGNGNWATKEDSVLAYNDENNNFKPLPFDFTRASTATYVDSDGLIKTSRNGEARIDYTDSTDGALLLEPARTNYCTNSEDFSQTYWTKGNGSVASGYLSPSGDINAYKLTEDSNNNNHYILSSPIASLSGDISISIFAKKGERNWIRLVNNNIVGAYFNLNDGSIGTTGTGVTAKMENYGNGWFRCTIIKNRSVAATERLIVYTSIDGTGTSYQGDGASGVLIYGAQIEVGNLSSYIPTSGSTVTRVAETASGSGNSEVFNDSEGVLFADIAALANDGTYRSLGVNSGSATNRLLLTFRPTNNQINYLIQVGGVTQVNILYVLTDATTYNKIALKYKSNDFSLWANGFEVETDTSGAAFSSNTLSELSLDNAASSDDFYGKTKELGYYDTALTDIELEELTSYRSWVSMVNELNLNIIYNG